MRSGTCGFLLRPVIDSTDAPPRLGMSLLLTEIRPVRSDLLRRRHGADLHPMWPAAVPGAAPTPGTPRHRGSTGVAQPGAPYQPRHVDPFPSSRPGSVRRPGPTAPHLGTYRRDGRAGHSFRAHSPPPVARAREPTAPLSVERARTSEMAAVVSALYTQARVAELSITKLMAGPHRGPL